MSQRSPSLHSAALLSIGSLGLLLASCGGSSATEGTDTPPATDTTPPFTQATPGGGLHSGYLMVTLESDEPATIYFTTDGSLPVPEEVTTYSGPSPISGIPVEHPLTLRYYGVDAEGNEETIEEEVYTFDVEPPLIFTMGDIEPTLGWLETSTITFMSNEDGYWSAELGGTGEPGTGTPYDNGFLNGNQLTYLDVDGWRLEPGQATQVYLYVTDLAGGLSQMDFGFQSLSSTSFPLAGTSGELAVTPDGRFLYVLRPDEGQVWKYDVALPDPTHAQLAVIDLLGSHPTSLAITPDSSRVYVTCDQQLDVIEIDPADVVTVIPMPGGVTPSGIEIMPDGTLAYFVGDDGYLGAIDVDPVSAQFHQVDVLEDFELFRTAGHIAITPAGDLAVVVWTGINAYGVQVLDTDPLNVDTTYQQVIGLPILPAAFLPLSVAAPSISLDGTAAYLGSELGKLSRVDLSAADDPPYQIAATNLMVAVTGSLSSPDGDVLLLFGGGLTGIRMADPQTLAIQATIPSASVGGAGVGDSLAFSADGSLGYLIRDQGSLTGEMWVLPLKH